VNEHGAHHTEDQQQINLSHPPVDGAANIRRTLRRRDVNVNFAQGEFLVRSRMTLAASLDELVEARIL
jgi:hypothetical protein